LAKKRDHLHKKHYRPGQFLQENCQIHTTEEIHDVHGRERVISILHDSDTRIRESRETGSSGNTHDYQRKVTEYGMTIIQDIGIIHPLITYGSCN
jgi:uncharacterized protein YerC